VSIYASRLFAVTLILALVTACGGGGSSNPAPVPTTSPSPVASTSPGSPTAYDCPSSDTVAAARTGGLAPRGDAVAHGPRKPARARAAQTGLLEVTYDLRTLSASRSTLAARESRFAATLVRELDFPRTGVATRILNVAPARVASATAALRLEPGVKSVTQAGPGRSPLTVTAPYFPDDPYFTGFQTTVAPAAGATLPPATYLVPPYEESASVPGQWNMHAIGLQNAFAYSQANNGSGITNADAIGSSAVKIAIIDTGVDTTHPELAGKVPYQRCFITNPSGTQSTSTFVTDQDGHGTDVAGIAAAATNNGLGFTAAGGNSVIYAYRVLPTPDDNCLNPDTTDDQCSAQPPDIASAILDAIAEKVNVISISLGSSASSTSSNGCSSAGVDGDSTEGNAIAEAIAANVVVVASAGNSGTAGVNAPACDAGVIAAGATSLADGQVNGTGTAGGSAAAPIEYVASYSDYGTPGAAARNAAAWGIVAPGGDPNPQVSDDPDDLHWIEDIYTTTPLDANYGSVPCGSDYPNDSTSVGTQDCRVLIAGTSMSAPTVAGAAALIIAVNPSYQSPSKMKSLLCATADDIGDGKEGCGRLNIYRAMATALGDPTLP
jgi:subtilisin family serine protease